MIIRKSGEDVENGCGEGLGIEGPVSAAAIVATDTSPYCNTDRNGTSTTLASVTNHRYKSRAVGRACLLISFPGLPGQCHELDQWSVSLLIGARIRPEASGNGGARREGKEGNLDDVPKLEEVVACWRLTPLLRRMSDLDAFRKRCVVRGAICIASRNDTKH